MNEYNSIARHCVNCAFFCKHKQDPSAGECRRNPPQAVAIEDRGNRLPFITHFPVVTATDWCGEFKRSRTI